MQNLTGMLLAGLVLAQTGPALARDGARLSVEEMRRMRRCDAMSHAHAMRDANCRKLMHDHHGMQQHGAVMMKTWS